MPTHTHILLHELSTLTLPPHKILHEQSPSHSRMNTPTTLTCTFFSPTVIHHLRPKLASTLCCFSLKHHLIILLKSRQSLSKARKIKIVILGLILSLFKTWNRPRHHWLQIILISRFYVFFLTPLRKTSILKELGLKLQPRATRETTLATRP